MSEPIQLPQTHEEPIASTLQALQLQKHSEPKSTSVVGLFEAHPLPQIRRIYGGELAAQSLLAGAATVPQRLVHSLTTYFVRGGDSAQPLRFEVTENLEGRSFANRHITCVQAERIVLQMDASFKQQESGANWAKSCPSVPEPHYLTSSTRLFHAVEHPMARLIGDSAAFDVRHVEPDIYLEPDPKRRSFQHVWMCPRKNIPGDPREHQTLHRALLLYAVDQIMLEPALRILGLSWLSEGLSMASLQHSMWFHQDIDINQWLLFHGECDFAGDGRAKAHVDIFDSAGNYLGAAAQEGMVRVPVDGRKGSGSWGFGKPLTA